MSKSCIIVMLLPFGGYTLAADRRRCRSLNHFGEIPPLLNSSTFYNLGHPLISKLCQESVNDQLLHDTVGCLAVRKRVWPVKCTDSARSGSGSSAIVIDPHVIAVRGHTSSAGVYVINALYPKLYELGYSPKVRYWSNELNDHFENSTSQIASNQSQLWDHYELGNADNPYIAIDNYILLQTEASNFFTQSIRTISNISESAHGRVFQWMIGLQHSSAHSFYASKVDEAHCLGANHFLGEGLYCSSASVISCPMFPFHRTESRAVNDKTRKALKQNIVLIDSDIMGNEISVERLQNALIALGVSDVQVLVHKGRQRHEVPELYVRTKVSIDCNNGGVEFINYEATLYDVLTLSCNSRATRNAFDYPVPSKYLLEPTNWPQLVNTVHKLLVNYTDHVPEFRHFKALSQSSDERALTQLDMTFFSRDVIFR